MFYVLAARHYRKLVGVRPDQTFHIGEFTIPITATSKTPSTWLPRPYTGYSLLRYLQRGCCSPTATAVVAAAAMLRHDSPFAAVDMANASTPSLLSMLVTVYPR